MKGCWATDTPASDTPTETRLRYGGGEDVRDEADADQVR